MVWFQTLSFFIESNSIAIQRSYRTNIFLDTRNPTQRELDSCPHIELTCNSEWNPHPLRLASTQCVEAEVSDITGDVEPGLFQAGVFQISSDITGDVESGLLQITEQESLHAVASECDVPGHRTFVSLFLINDTRRSHRNSLANDGILDYHKRDK